MITPRESFAFVFVPALALAAAGCLTESALEALSGPDDSAATASSSESEGGGTEGSGASGGGGGPDSGHVTLGSTTSTVTSATSDGPISDTDDGSSSDTDATAGDGSTTSIDPPPMLPPAIVGHDLSPVPIEQNGPVLVTIVAEHAEGVRMVAGDGVEVELSPTPDPEVFVGEIPALTGFDNGDHVAAFRPWRGEDEGDEVEVVYTLNLPTPGSELFFETGNLIGSGRVAAMGHLPSQAIVEFGMLTDGQNIPRCYLRYRTQAGKWGPNDVVQVLPGSACEAIDLEVGDGGETYLLARWKTNNDYRWWLGVIPSWGVAAQTISMGTWGEEAYAIAHHGGAVAVCGSVKTTEGDLDAIVRVYREGKEEAIGLFDYETEQTEDHWFSESARDCIFVDSDNLVLVGEAFGRHEWNDMEFRDRRFILPYEIGSDAEPKFIVAAPGPGNETQSVARGVARDDAGHLFIVGRVCEDDCVADGRLWIHDADGTPKSETALGVFSNDIFSPRVVRWSPAGYAVVASGGAKGKEADFTVRAYEPFMLDPVWSYAGPGSQHLNVALALSIGPYAEVCAGGFGLNAYPAVACFGS